MTPQTEAGRAFSDELLHDYRLAGMIARDVNADILAIEVEAAAQALADLREKVEGLPGWRDESDGLVDRAAVLPSSPHRHPRRSPNEPRKASREVTEAVVPLSPEEVAAIRARDEAGQPLKAFDWHAARGRPEDWAMARVFVEETANDRRALLSHPRPPAVSP